MRWALNRKVFLNGLLIFATGDTIAALILHEFLWTRMLGMMLVGGFIYTSEIPAYFRWIENQSLQFKTRFKRSFFKTSMVLLYFNPLWIARHLFFIKLFSFAWHDVSWHLLYIGGISYMVNIPISFCGNVIIQVIMPLRYRFYGSAVFSALMAIYYALSAHFI